MKRACIDTHTLVWYLMAPKRLGRAAARLLRAADAGDTQIEIPAIVLIELSLIDSAGRRVIGPLQVEALIASQPAFQLLPLGMAQAKEFAQLTALRDPFDRMIVAAARAERLPLITADGVIEESALVETIWD